MSCNTFKRGCNVLYTTSHYLEDYVALHLACIQKQLTSTRTSVVFHASQCIEIACSNCMHCKIHYKIEMTSRMSLNACFFFECSILHLSSNNFKVGGNTCCSLPMTSRIVCNKCCKPCLTINSTCGICWICCNAHHMNLNTTHMDVLQYLQAWVQRTLHNLHYLEGYVALHLACNPKAINIHSNKCVSHASQCIEIAWTIACIAKCIHITDVCQCLFICSSAAFSPILQQLQGWMQHQLQLANDVKWLFATNLASHASQ